MLSDETLKILEIDSLAMLYSGAAPLVWIQNKDGHPRTQLQNFKGYKIYTLFHLLVLLFYNTFMAYRVASVLINHTQENGETNSQSLATILQVLWNFLSYSLPLIVMFNNFKFWKELPLFTNAFFDTTEKFKDKFMKNPDEKKWKNGCETKLKILRFLATLIFIQNVVLVFKKPERPYFLTSLLENPQKTQFLRKLPLIGAQIWVWLSLWAHIFYFCFMHISYGYLIVFILSQLREDVKTVETRNYLRQPLTFVKVYRQLQILHVNLNSCFKSFYFPIHKFVLVNIAILGVYGSIRISGPRGIIMGIAAIMALSYLSILFRRMGKLYEESLNALQSWKYEQRKYIRKFVRSSQPIRVEIGSYYFVIKSTVIVIWATVFNFTTNMLLSF